MLQYKIFFWNGGIFLYIETEFVTYVFVALWLVHSGTFCGDELVASFVDHAHADLALEIPRNAKPSLVSYTFFHKRRKPPHNTTYLRQEQ